MSLPDKISFEEFCETITTPVLDSPMISQFSNAYSQIKKDFIQCVLKNSSKTIQEIVLQLYQLTLKKNESNFAFFEINNNIEYYGFEILLGIIGVSKESIKNIIFENWEIIL